MHFKETVSILSLKYELNQIKNGKMLKFCEFTLYLPPGPPTLPPEKNFNILGGKVRPPSLKNHATSMLIKVNIQFVFFNGIDPC